MKKRVKDQKAKEISQFCLKLTNQTKTRDKLGETVTKAILPAVVAALGMQVSIAGGTGTWTANQAGNCR